MVRFQDRREAGRMLAERLADERLEHPVVLGLPRGGVPVAAEVARVLDAPLDVLVVRKLGVPGFAEVAMGAVGEGGVAVVNQDVLAIQHVASDVVEAVRRREEAEVERRIRLFREGRPAIGLRGRCAIVVDDGVATGATARAACAIVRARGAASVLLAVPVAAPEALATIADAGRTLALLTPVEFLAVGMHYVDFRQVDDDEVVRLLRPGPAE